MFELVVKIFTEILSGISTIEDIKSKINKSRLDNKSIAIQLVELHSSLDSITTVLTGISSELQAYSRYLVTGGVEIDAILYRLKAHLQLYKKELERIHIILFGADKPGIGRSCYCGYEPRNILKLLSLYSPMNYQHVINLLEGEGEALAEVVMAYLYMLDSANRQLDQRVAMRLVKTFKPAHWGYSWNPKEFIDLEPIENLPDTNNRIVEIETFLSGIETISDAVTNARLQIEKLILSNFNFKEIVSQYQQRKE